MKDKMYGQTFNLHSVCLMRSETIFGFCMYALIQKNCIKCFFEPFESARQNDSLKSSSAVHSEGIVNYVQSTHLDLGMYGCWSHISRGLPKKSSD